MEVRDRQEQLTLAVEPAMGRVMPALRTSSVTARVIEQMHSAAVVALGEVPAQCAGAAPGDGKQGTGVTGQNGVAVTSQVIAPVPTYHVSKPEHGPGWDYRSAISRSRTC
jgi:hypothetical protein